MKLALVIAAAIAAASCGGAPDPSEAPAPPALAADVVSLSEDSQQRAGIVVAPAGWITRADATEAPGIVALDETRTARVGSLVDGIVAEVRVQPGTRVKAGQTLASVHSHAVHDAWAGYRKAQADERRLIAELQYASEAEARADRLYQDKAVALQDLQRAHANRVSAEEALGIGRAELRRSEEELSHLGIAPGADATQESEQIPVLTPFSGVVLERLVTPGTAVTPGMQMFVVSDLSRVWVLAELDEAHLSRAAVGRPARVRVAAYPGEWFPATVTYIAEAVDPKTRRVTVRCETPNEDGRLKAEMYATVDIGESDARSIVAVPAAAIQVVNGQSSVFVREADGTFHLQAVDTGTEGDGLVEIRRGLQAGDPVVTAGAFVLKSELLKSSMTGE
ncbi:MAG: efflux RND transporter periplasmic adaptor subunit [Vicinamibacterales bacterium]